jgi:hypothetical protein
MTFLIRSTAPAGNLPAGGQLTVATPSLRGVVDGVPDGYVVVKKESVSALKPDKDDSESNVKDSESKTLQPPRLLRQPGRSARGSYLKKIGTLKTWLWNVSSTTSSAATAQAPVFRLRPSDSAEFADLANLFDELRVVAAKARYAVSLGGSGVTTIDTAMAYDPVNSGAYSSVVAVLPAAHHVGPNRLHASNSNPEATSRSGFWEFPEFQLPKGPQGTDFVSSAVATGQWQDTGVTAVDYGYFKGYINAASNGTTTCTIYIGMLCELRCRS